MFDEVQCGTGRTGKLFAHEWAGVEPDILAAAKGLGGGFPVGACLANERAAAVMGAGSHGSTFGGNPLAMAVAGGVLEIILADGFLEGVQVIAKAFHDRLETITKAHPKVLSEVRGKGLMLGLKCVVDNTALSAKLFENGLVTVVAGDNVVRIVPPLIIDESHVEEAAGIIEASCAELTEGA